VLVALLRPVHNRVTAVTRLSETAAAVSRDRVRRPHVTGSIRVPRSITAPRPTEYPPGLRHTGTGVDGRPQDERFQGPRSGQATAPAGLYMHTRCPEDQYATARNGHPPLRTRQRQRLMSRRILQAWRYNCATTGSARDTWTTGSQAGRMVSRHCGSGQAFSSSAHGWIGRMIGSCGCVGYSAPDGFKAAEERYHALPERLSLHPDPSDFVETATLDMVESLQ
jgi:hypothetical protein